MSRNVSIFYSLVGLKFLARKLQPIAVCSETPPTPGLRNFTAILFQEKTKAPQMCSGRKRLLKVFLLKVSFQVVNQSFQTSQQHNLAQEPFKGIG